MEIVDFTLPKLDLQELDHLVLEGGGIVSSSGRRRTVEVPPQHDWGFRWIHTRGTGNLGSLLAIPRSARAAGVMNQALRNRVTKLTGDGKFSEDYLLFSKGVQYAMEEHVIQLVHRHGHELVTSREIKGWKSLEQLVSPEVMEFIKEHRLSIWRVYAAITVSRKLYATYC